MMDIAEFLISFDNDICLSGGATGSDLQWGMNAGKAGHSVIHWSFEGHQTLAPDTEVIRLNDDQLLRADLALKRANKVLKRRFPSNSDLTNNLLRRNFYQIAWTQSLYAVAEFDNKKIVKGGTAWAVQMYMDRFIHDDEPMDNCKLFLFEPNQNVWWSWKGNWSMLTSAPQKPKGIWTGIGTRNLSVGGKYEIRKLMGNISSDPIEDSTQIVNLEPKIGDIIYIEESRIPGEGIDDYTGGQAMIQNIQKGLDAIYVSVREISGKYFKWTDLIDKQESLKKIFGLQKASPKADMSPSNNYKTPYYRIKT